MCGILLLALLAMGTLAAGIDFKKAESHVLLCPNHLCPERQSKNNDSCKCDTDCILYGDCCLNARVRENKDSNDRKSTASFGCFIAKDAGFDFYVKTSCHPSWKGFNAKKVRDMCENSPLNRIPRPGAADPLALSLVSSSRFTYKNYFCALCNNDHFNLTFWKMAFYCEGVSKGDDIWAFEKIILSYLKYDPHIHTWGIWLKHSDGLLKFHRCTIEYLHSGFNENMIKYRSCNARETRTCLPSWAGSKEIARKCESYQASIVHNGRAFKNLYCAICNDMDPKDSTCKLEQVREWNFRPFTLYLDFNINFCESQDQCCQDDEIYDPLFKRCRNLKCIWPTYQLVNGACVKMPQKKFILF